MTDAEYTAWLKDQSAIRCVLIEADVKVGGSVVTRYLSNRGYVTRPSDTPANTSYLPRVVGGIKVGRKLSLDSSIQLSFGDIELTNFDGLLDSWADDYWVNRSIKIYLGDSSWVRSDFRLVFSGITTGIDTRKRDSVNIKISDKLQRLNYPVSETKLGGTSSLADNLIPLLFGECHNIEPLLVDASVNEYQIHNGPVESIFEVRDNGIPVLYTPFVSTGKFRLNQAPAGQITCSAQGYMRSQNMLQYSEAFDNVYWTKSSCTATANATVAPDGTTTAEKLTENTAASVTHFFSRNLVFTAGQYYTFSVYIKAAGRTGCRVSLSSTLFAGGPNLYVNLTDGSITSTVDCTYAVASVGNGWYRCSLSALCDTSGTGGASLFPTIPPFTSTYTGDGTSGIYVWGAQVELGDSPSAYVKTTTATANIFPRTTAELIRVVSTQYGSATNMLASADIDWTNFEAFNTANPQPVGIYLKSRANVLDVCNQLASSLGARLTVGNTGLVGLVKLELPQSTPGTSIGVSDFVDRSIEVSQLVPVVASIKLGYCKNWTVQETLAAGLVINTVALFNEEWLTVTRTDSAASTNYNLFVDPEMTETLLLVNVDAVNEANRRLNIFNVQRKVIRYRGFYHLIFENLGASQTITHPRFGLASGKTGQIISITTDLLSPHVDFEVLI